MATVLLARILSITLHLTILGSLVDVDLQLHKGRVQEAFTHTAAVSACILMLAIAGYVATKLLSKNAGNLRIDVMRVPIEKSRPARKRKTNKRKGNPKRKVRQR